MEGEITFSRNPRAIGHLLAKARLSQSAHEKRAGAGRPLQLCDSARGVSSPAGRGLRAQPGPGLRRALEDHWGLGWYVNAFMQLAGTREQDRRASPVDAVCLGDPWRPR